MNEVVEKTGIMNWLGRQAKQVRGWLRHRLGIDRAIAFTILWRGWASLARLVTVALIARFLTPAQQGYYYTFGSLVALQIVFELGFSFVILQMASHERAHLNIAPDDSISGDPVAHDRLASVLQKTVRWYATLAVLLGAFLLVAGLYFFSSYHHGAEDVAWRMPWFADVLAASITFQLDPILSFLEGCGFVANVARVRLFQSMVSSGLAWIALFTHHGLYAPALIIAGNACVSLAWMSLHHRRLLLSLLRRDAGHNRISWMTEVWGFQWRIAVSWLCGYFIFQIFNPVLFAYRGAVAAGQMGMTLSLSSALQGLAAAWLNTKAAPFGAMIARREFSRVDDLFFRSMRQAVTICAFGAICLVLGDTWLTVEKISFARRLLSPELVAVLMGAAIINVIVSGEALYLRAHKQEKFLLNSILGAIMIAFFTLVLGKFYGAAGMVAGTLITGLFMGLPLGTWTFLKYRRIWHAN